MQIGFLTPFVPYPLNRGINIRNYHILKRLCSHHQVDLYIPLVEDVDEAALRAVEALPSNVHVFRGRATWSKAARLRQLLEPVPFGLSQCAPKDTVARVRAILSSESHDLLYVDELFMAPYAWNLSPPKLLARHKIEVDYYCRLVRWAPTIKERLLYLIEWPKVRRLERQAWRAYPAGIVCSEKDRDSVFRINRAVDILIATNGVDLEQFALKPPKDDPPPRLLLMGDMRYAPNIDGVAYFFRDIYPLLRRPQPNLRVVIVGHNPPSQIQKYGQLPGVTITGSVPDIRPYLEDATVLLVPLRIGGGTRIKIPEAMAAGRPVVSTSIGCQGLEVKDSENILIADDPLSFAGKTLLLLENRNLRQRLAHKARELVESRYSWAEIASQIEQFCIETVDKGKR